MKQRRILAELGVSPKSQRNRRGLGSSEMKNSARCLLCIRRSNLTFFFFAYRDSAVTSDRSLSSCECYAVNGNWMCAPVGVGVCEEYLTLPSLSRWLSFDRTLQVARCKTPISRLAPN